MLEVRTVMHGLRGATFKDSSGRTCSIQESSAAEAAGLWLGLAVVAGKPGRMHLRQEQARDLVPLLQRFAQEGALPPGNDDLFYVLSLKYSRSREIVTWWGPRRQGYSALLDNAGVYTREEVLAADLSNGETTLAVPARIVDELAHPVVHERDVGTLIEAGMKEWGIAKIRTPREEVLSEVIRDVIEDLRNDTDRADIMARLMRALDEDGKAAR